MRMAVTSQGDLHCEALHEPSGSRLETDAPKDNEGRGERFSPTDLVGAALGSCMLTVMGIVARRHAWDMTGARAEVEKDMVAAPIRRIARLGLRIAMPAGIPASARAVLERAAHTCPVHQSLHPDVKIELQFEWK
ncbi:MAG: OsmC family protein [Myxococcota bacterium]